ncbi:hypothetical protein J0S82_013195 [Galemys pyrenaicus]|uniref:Uncharacterized protein n=1 Tax=Galemys pyrenaicus TaxID=202257 RepID=A0A8J5ZU33_GALPY|nr:hypothetical protein J0S82_013195 [Galemys pyrenaicus]
MLALSLVLNEQQVGSAGWATGNSESWQGDGAAGCTDSRGCGSGPLLPRETVHPPLVPDTFSRRHTSPPRQPRAAARSLHASLLRSRAGEGRPEEEQEEQEEEEEAEEEEEEEEEEARGRRQAGRAHTPRDAPRVRAAQRAQSRLRPRGPGCPMLCSMANSGCLLLSNSGSMLPHSVPCPPAFLYLQQGCLRGPGEQVHLAQALHMGNRALNDVSRKEREGGERSRLLMGAVQAGDGFGSSPAQLALTPPGTEPRDQDPAPLSAVPGERSPIGPAPAGADVPCPMRELDRALGSTGTATEKMQGHLEPPASQGQGYSSVDRPPGPAVPRPLASLQMGQAELETCVLGPCWVKTGLLPAVRGPPCPLAPACRDAQSTHSCDDGCWSGVSQEPRPRASSLVARGGVLLREEKAAASAQPGNSLCRGLREEFSTHTPSHASRRLARLTALSCSVQPGHPSCCTAGLSFSRPSPERFPFQRCRRGAGSGTEVQARPLASPHPLPRRSLPRVPMSTPGGPTSIPGRAGPGSQAVAVAALYGRCGILGNEIFTGSGPGSWRGGHRRPGSRDGWAQLLVPERGPRSSLAPVCLCLQGQQQSVRPAGCVREPGRAAVMLAEPLANQPTASSGHPLRSVPRGGAAPMGACRGCGVRPPLPPQLRAVLARAGRARSPWNELSRAQAQCPVEPKEVQTIARKPGTWAGCGLRPCPCEALAGLTAGAGEALSRRRT